MDVSVSPPRTPVSVVDVVQSESTDASPRPSAEHGMTDAFFRDGRGVVQ